MTDCIAVPQRTSNTQRNQRYSRHRLSTTPPRVNSQHFMPEEEFVISDEESDEEYLNDSTVQLLFNKIYIDPLQDEFEMLDGEAGTILRTGKFSVTGETGNMDLLQQLIFSLQATEEDLTVLLPQLMQNPFFNPSKRTPEFFMDPVLSGGQIRLGVKVDTVIYDLLSSFCTKGPGSKQADALISTALKTAYSLPNNPQTFQFKWRNGPPLVANGYIMNSSSPIGEDSDGSEDEVLRTPTITIDKYGRTSNSSITSSGLGSSMKGDRESISSDYPPQDMISPLSKVRERTGSGGGLRRDSFAGIQFPFNLRSSSSQAFRKPSDNSESSMTSLLAGDSNWQASIDSASNDMIIGCYSDNSYSILMWNPKFRVGFELGSEEDGMCTTTYCVNPNKPSVSFHITNHGNDPIAFSIRAYRQSLMFRSHVIFPSDGLKDLDPHEEFWQEFDVVGSKDTKRDEHIIVDLLVCKLHGEPSWNVQRRYVILKYDEERTKMSNSEQRLLHKLFDNGYPLQPGVHKDLSTTLKQVMLHGLQCVVKNKIEEAEVIFTQALYLPLFQRVPLKAFVYICLAVIADKRRKSFNETRVHRIFKLVTTLDELLDACESAAAPQLQMPKLFALVKQLKKELNYPKILEIFRSSSEMSKVKRLDATNMATPDGSEMKLNETTISIPPGGLLQETKVMLNTMGQTEIHQTLQTSPWASMLKVITAFNIACTPPVDRFSKPITASIVLPRDNVKPPVGGFRLLQSKFTNNWIDITDDPASKVTVTENSLTVKTDYTGWILVASINLDMSQILQMAVKSIFTEEPIVLHVNVFGRLVSGNSQEITAFLTPSLKDDSVLNQKKDSPSFEHKRISFPHSFKAYKGQKIRLEIQSSSCDQNTLGLEHIVDSQLEAVMSTDITYEPQSVQKIVITKYCNIHNKWENVQDIRLNVTKNVPESPV